MSGLARRVGATLVLGTMAVGVGLIPAGRPASAATVRVLVGNLRFDPPVVEIELGDTVVWNVLDDGHTVTARDGSFDSSSQGAMEEGDRYRYRFREPGRYAYFCRVHARRGMTGEIVVLDPDKRATSTTRAVPVTTAAPATTATTLPTTTSSTEPPTTTSRVLATSSSTSPAPVTRPPAGAPVEPQAPPALNPSGPVVGGGVGGVDLPEARAAAERSDARSGYLPAVVIGVAVILALFGAAVGVRIRRRRAT